MPGMSGLLLIGAFAVAAVVAAWAAVRLLSMSRPAAAEEEPGA
jgi:hypothetical protein